MSGKKLEEEMKESADQIEAAEEAFGAKALVTPNELSNIAGLGMRGVDPLDIRPPAILLAQKSSDLTNMTDKFGKEAQVGQFYHTGKKEILNEFDCYFLLATKGTYVDKRKPEEGAKPMYRALGVMKEDLSPFGMTFRSSSLYCLSSLFTATQAQQAPMFAFNIHMEVKKLEGDKGTWYVPVCRVGAIEQDRKVLDELYSRAFRLDQRSHEVSTQGEDD